jgi:DNA-binding transcriptional MerR regulator
MMHIALFYVIKSALRNKIVQIGFANIAIKRFQLKVSIVMDGFRTKQLAEWLGVSEVTLRQWTTGEWAEYLSPTAQGGDGRRRFFTERDARIAAYIWYLKEHGEPKRTIHDTLRRMMDEDWANLPDMPPAPPSMGPISMMPREAADAAITQQRAALLREITMLNERVQQLEGQLGNEKALRDQDRERHAQEMQKLRDELEVQREKYLREIANLNREIGRLEGRMESKD